MRNDIMVSIVCNTFNHELYIESALNGFLQQKTSFNYEILVHDDCSTDNTAKIIRQYEDKYPKIIKAIYQPENQLSKGVEIGRDIQYPRAQGKYIALCEGDDYWIDPYKLQKQVDYMESHPDCTFCFTNAKCEIDGKYTRDVIPWKDDSVVLEGNEYDIDAIERLNYIPTATFLFRTASIPMLPRMREGAFKGDGYIKIGFTAQGYAYYMPECTSVYRYMVPNSATTQWKRNRTKLIRTASKFIMMYEDFDSCFQGKYPIFRDRILGWEIEKYFATEEYVNLRERKYIEYYKKYNKKGYPIFIFAITFPAGYRTLRKVKRKIFKG